MAIIVTCTCGKQFKVKDELAGKRGKCAACGQVLSVPTLASSADQEKATPAPLRACPMCRQALQPMAVICLNCGLDLRTGKKVSAATPSATEDTPEAAPEPSRKPPTPRLRNAILFGAIGVAVLVGTAVLYFLVVRTARFEEAFAAGRISWEPVSNIEVVTQEGNNRIVQSHNFVQKIQYDENGRGTVSKEGLKTYKWRSREATFGPGAVIRLTQNSNVREGALRAGEEWTWTGQQWTAKPPGPVAQSPSPKADVPVAKKEGPDSKVTPDQTNDPPALKKLLAKVTAITPADVATYEKFLREPTTFNAILSFGSLPYTGDDVREVINLGLEKPAVAALAKLAQEKKISTDKADLLICAQSIKALGQFGPAAREAAPLLAELQNHKDIAVGSSAKAAIKAINGTPQTPTTPPAPSGLPPDAALRKELKDLLNGRKRPNSNVMLRRTGTFTVPESNAWTESLQSIRPDLDKKQTFFMMLEIDALYKEDGTFLPDDSAKYRRRFKSIPQSAIKTWAGNWEGSSEASAAIMLMQIDTLFDNDLFQSSRLDSALRILKELKENKDM